MKAKLIMLVLFTWFIQGCSVVQATSGPESKDLSVLEVGSERDRVLAELGQPLVSEKNDDGTRYDIFKFKQGQHGAVKASKALLYGSLAVATLGVSELVTSPLEGATNKGAEIQLKAIYDENNRVKDIVVFKDDRWVPVQVLEEETQSE